MRKCFGVSGHFWCVRLLQVGIEELSHCISLSVYRKEKVPTIAMEAIAETILLAYIPLHRSLQ